MKELFGLEGKAALVVGGGYGHGAITAKLLAQAGARVAVADIDGDRARNVAEAIGGHAITADVTTPEAAAYVVDEAHRRLGALSRLANVVGLIRWGDFLDSDLAHWQQQFQLNLYQQMFVAQAAGRRMIAEGGGVIAMTSSVSGLYGHPGGAAYGMAKAGVMSLARTLANEWGPHGVRVNTIAPDITATPRVVAGVPAEPEEVMALFDASAVEQGVPLQRFGRTHELAGPLLFLLSDLSSYMTGQNLVVDGGAIVRFPHHRVVAPKAADPAQ